MKKNKTNITKSEARVKSKMNRLKLGVFLFLGGCFLLLAILAVISISNETFVEHRTTYIVTFSILIAVFIYVSIAFRKRS